MTAVKQGHAHLLDALLQQLLVSIRERALAQVAVVVEALLQRGPDGELRAKTGLQRLAQHVRAAVPEGLRAQEAASSVSHSPCPGVFMFNACRGPMMAFLHCRAQSSGT